VQGLDDGPHGAPELAVTLIRAVGWMSRFDLANRTAGAGPQLATPGAQCQGPHTFDLGFRWGTDVEDDLALAAAAAEHRSPLRAVQLHEPPVHGSTSGSVLAVREALVTAWKVAEDGIGSVLRLSNPTPTARQAVISGEALQMVRSVEQSDLDERRTTEQRLLPNRELRIEMAPFALRLMP